MAFLRRLLQRFRNPTYFVGRDLEGNRFYEYPSVTEDPRRTKRVVKYKHAEHMWDYVSRGKELPVQWTAWLTHTRRHPPTPEELQADLERQERVRLNAAMIEARDRAWRSSREITDGSGNTPAIAAPVSQESPGVTEGQGSATSSGPPAGSDRHDAHDKSAPSQTNTPNPWVETSSDDPQAWQPRTVKRGGGCQDQS